MLEVLKIFFMEYGGYLLLFLTTFVSTIFYTIKGIYTPRENVKIVLIVNTFYMALNSINTRKTANNVNLVLTMIASIGGSNLGYLFGFIIKNFFDSSLRNKEENIWAIDVNVDDKLAKKFNEVFAKPNNIDAIYLSTNEWRYICGSKVKSKIVRNFVETYELPHIIQEHFKWINKKLSPQQKGAIKRKIGM